MPSAFGDLNGSGNQQVWINVARTGQNINGNYSTYSGEVRYYGNGWGSYTGSLQYWSASFGGYNVSGSFTIPIGNRYDTYTVLWTGSFTKSHAADGTLAAFGCSATIDSDHSSIGDGTASTTEPAPPTIPRASTPTFVGGAALTTALPVTINTNRASSGFTHDITWALGSLSGQTSGFSASTGIGTSLTWTPPVSMLTQIPNAATGSGSITLTTKSGATVIGTKVVAFTMTADSSVVPTISSVTIADQNSLVVAQVGAYVQSLSILKGTVNAAGVQGSTIASAQWSMAGISAASAANIVPITSGTVAIGAAATDTRGRVGTYSNPITVMPYSVPKINSSQVRRALSSGVVNDNGTYLRIDLNAAVQSLIVGTEKNTLTIKVFTRLYGTTTWTARNVINHSSVSYNTNVLVTGGAIFPVNQSFDVKIEVTDKFNTANPALSQTVVSTAAIFMHWSQTGIGVGKYHTQGVLDVAGDIYQNNNKVIDVSALQAPVGVIQGFAGVSEPSSQWKICNGEALSRSTYAELYAVLGTRYGAGDGSTTFNLPNLKGRIPVGSDSGQTEFDVLGETGGAKTHTLTIAEMPSHSHKWAAAGTNAPGSTPANWDDIVGGNVAALGTGPAADEDAGNAIKPRGGNGAHNNLQPYLVINYIIRVLN